MTTQSALTVYTKPGGRNGGNGHHAPSLITGHDIAALTNDVGELDAIAAQLVRGELQLVRPTIPQVSAITLVTRQRIYEALHRAPKTHNGNGKLDAFVRSNLADVWDAVSRAIAA